MAGHKLTFLGDPAFKRVQIYLQHADLHQTERRVAYGDGVLAISGRGGVALAHEQYGLDFEAHGLLQQFNAMLQGHGFQRAENRPADVCAEAHLWMSLVGIHQRYLREGQAPRHAHLPPHRVDAWVYEIDRKNRPKEDSPCGNCRQWARREFQTVNGTS